MKWVYKRRVFDNEPYFINHVNIWEHKWINTRKHLQVEDPLYGQEFKFPIYEIHTEDQTIRFSTGEFSNNVWGIYEEEKDRKYGYSKKNLLFLGCGIFITVLGIIMFFIGISAFSAKSDDLKKYPILELGEFCFIFWSPTLLFGFIFSFFCLFRIFKESS